MDAALRGTDGLLCFRLGQGAQAEKPQIMPSASPACMLMMAQKDALDGALTRLIDDANTLPDDDPLRCDALRRIRKVAEWRLDMVKPGATCGISGYDAETARRVAEVDSRITACPPITAGACAISTRQFVSAMQDVLQESALSIYANAAASGKEVCRFVGVMRGVLIEARPDADVIERSCNDKLATGTDDERGLLIAFTEARQKVDRHDIAIKPKITACPG